MQLGDPTWHKVPRPPALGGWTVLACMAPLQESAGSPAAMLRSSMAKAALVPPDGGEERNRGKRPRNFRIAAHAGRDACRACRVCMAGAG